MIMSATLTKTGFAGFICEISGDNVDAGYCVTCARMGAPGCEIGSPAIISGILKHIRPAGFSARAAQDARPDVEADVSLSVTEMLGCARKAHLMQTEPWYDKPSRLYWAYRGTLFHGEAEAYAGDDVLAISEQRLFWFFKTGGKTVSISGQPDLLLFDQQFSGWRIVDYKTTKEVPGKRYRYTCLATNKVIYEVPYRVKGKGCNCPHCVVQHPFEEVDVQELPPGPHGSHDAQLQVYTTLIEKNGALLANLVNQKAGRQVASPGSPILGAELVYLDMSSQKRIAVPIQDSQTRMALIKERLAPHLSGDLPGMIDAADAWQCNYCPVRASCEERAESPIE